MLLNAAILVRSASTESSNIATSANVDHAAAADGDDNNTVITVMVVAVMMIEIIMVAVI
jgi:hypothetical protein